MRNPVKLAKSIDYKHRQQVNGWTPEQLEQNSEEVKRIYANTEFKYKYEGVASTVACAWSGVLEPLNENEFWMTLEEFCQYFESYAISETIKTEGVVPNELTSIEVPRNSQEIVLENDFYTHQQPEYYLFPFKVKAGSYTLSFSQKDANNFNNSDVSSLDRYNYHNCRMIVFHNNNPDFADSD